MRVPILKQLYDAFDKVTEEEKMIVICHSIPKDFSVGGIIFLDEVLMKQEDGTIVKKKMVTTQAIRIIDIRPIAVLIETPCLVYICMKPGAQDDSDQIRLKKALNGSKSEKFVKVNTSYIHFNSCEEENGVVKYFNYKEDGPQTLIYDRVYNFGNVLLGVKVDKPDRTNAIFNMDVLVNDYFVFYPQLAQE